MVKCCREVLLGNVVGRNCEGVLWRGAVEKCCGEGMKCCREVL